MTDTRFIFRPVESWPGERGRQVPSQFSAPWPDTLALLDREIGQLQKRTRPREAVVQLHLTEGDLRQDGLIRANARLWNPGAVLSFQSDTGPLQFACDRFDDWRGNVRAIALALESLRRVDRYGIGRGHEQYRGYQAIGSARAMGPDDTMTLDEAVRLLLAATEPTTVDLTTPDGVHAAWRLASRTAHPDAGGDATAFRRLTNARDLIVESLR